MTDIADRQHNAFDNSAKKDVARVRCARSEPFSVLRCLRSIRPTKNTPLNTVRKMLPESKDCFPKLLYLDQNKWLDLSRAHYGHPEGKPFKDALSAVRNSVKAGKLLVPFSAVSILEMANDPYADRRERLARFMVDLSCNRTILPFTTVRPWEIRNAVYALFGRPVPGCIRSSIVSDGLANAWAMRLRVSGLPEEVEAMVHHVCDSPGISIALLLERADQRDSVNEFRTEENSTLAIQESVRERCAAEGIRCNQRLYYELRNHFSNGTVGAQVAVALQEINRGMPAFWDRVTNPDEFVKFFAHVPSFDVTLTLRLARDRDLVRKIDQNDSRDLIWLSVALPYSNVVVAENYWGQMIRSRGLDKTYRTTVTTDAREIPDRLREMGCI